MSSPEDDRTKGARTENGGGPKSGPASAGQDHGSARLNPGDQGSPDTPGTGENVCRRCAGSGKIAGGAECPDCGGTGVVIEELGGA